MALGGDNMSKEDTARLTPRFLQGCRDWPGHPRPPPLPPAPPGRGTPVVFWKGSGGSLGRGRIRGRKERRHALRPGAGKGGEEEEEEDEDGLRQHLSSSGWFRRLGRRTGTPPALGISGTTAGRKEEKGGCHSTQPHGAEPPAPKHKALHAAASPAPQGSLSSLIRLDKRY